MGFPIIPTLIRINTIPRIDVYFFRIVSANFLKPKIFYIVLYVQSFVRPNTVTTIYNVEVSGIAPRPIHERALKITILIKQISNIF